MKPGDYMFLQFIHNDPKASWPQTYVEPGRRTRRIWKVYIAEARLRGAIPVLVTGRWDPQRARDGAADAWHGGYPQAMKEVAEEEHVAFIDLYGMSDHVSTRRRGRMRGRFWRMERTSTGVWRVMSLPSAS